MHLQSEQTRKCHQDFNHLFASVTTENRVVTFCSSANVENSSRLMCYEFQNVPSVSQIGDFQGLNSILARKNDLGMILQNIHFIVCNDRNRLNVDFRKNKKISA